MKKIIPFALVGATLVLAGCMSTSISSADADKLTAEITANSFQSKGIAKVERLQPIPDHISFSFSPIKNARSASL